MTRVVWLTDIRLCWDQHLVASLLDGSEWVHEIHDPNHDGPEIRGAGAVVIVPARYFTAYEVNVLLASLPWVVIILTSDEESTFEHTALRHPHQSVCVMTPRPGMHEPGGWYIGEGCADVHEIDSSSPPQRDLDVQFAGQVTHQRRLDMVAALDALDGPTSSCLTTPGFTAGMPRHEYLAELTQSRIVLCPSGPATPDSFRVYEALEAGAVPIVDGLCPAYPEAGYWSLVYPHGVPFPVVHDWADELAKTVDAVLANWRPLATRCQAWWLLQKHQLRARIEDEVRRHVVGGDEITVLVTTSPTSMSAAAQHEMLEATLHSVRARLPQAHVIVVADGVRDEQEQMRGEYEGFLARLVWSCARDWQNVLPIVLDHHAHQANAARVAMEHVRTPVVLFVEHDTPLCEQIPFRDLVEVIRSGYANVVRLHHEAHVLDPHQHLMLDREPRTIAVGPKPLADMDTVPLLRTVQWSQRPHLASAGFYRQILGSYFGTESRTMIEDVMHGVVQDAWNRHGIAGWEQFRLVMYAPPGDMKRSLHLDGRGGDPKYDMRYAYDGPTPTGAPAPTTP